MAEVPEERRKASGMIEKSDEYYSPEETDQRVRAIVRAAAKTLPIPLKAIPKKHGGMRKLRPAKSKRAKA